MTSVLTDEPVAAIPEPGRTRRAVIAALVVFGLVAVLVGAVILLRTATVEVSIDGEIRTVETRAASVDALLRELGVDTANQDVVEPPRTAPLTNGDTVAVLFARPLTVVVDGVATEHTTTALSLGDALVLLDIAADDAAVSHGLDTTLPRSGLTVEIVTPKPATISVGGEEARRVTTTAVTVADVLAAEGVALAETDAVVPTPETVVTPEIAITVTRIRIESDIRTEPVLHDTIEQDDADLTVGTRDVTTEGVDGEQEVTYAVTYTNGEATAEEVVSSTITVQPVTEMVAVGTKPAPATPPPSTEAGSLNWAALADCESSGNPRAVNPAGYYGLYQFSLATWSSVGGAGNPIDATPEEQLNRAQILYDRSGPGQWPTCGRLLFQ